MSATEILNSYFTPQEALGKNYHSIYRNHNIKMFFL